MGFIYVFSSKQVATFSDLKALKPWMWEGDPIAQAAYQAIGVSPVPLSITDVMTSLQTGMIDSVYSSPYALIALQWFTKVSYAMSQPLADAMGAAVISKKVYDALPDDLKTILMTNAKKYISRVTAASRQDNAKAIETLKQRGMKFVQAPKEISTEFDAIGTKARAAPRGKPRTRSRSSTRSRVPCGPTARSIPPPDEAHPRHRPGADHAGHRAPRPFIRHHARRWPSCRFSCGRSSTRTSSGATWRHVISSSGWAFSAPTMASRAGRHFHVGFLSRFLGPRLRSWLSVISDLFAAGVCGYLVAAAWTFVTVGLDPHAVLFLGIRQTAAAMIVPAGFLLMSLQFILRTIQGAAQAARRGPAEDQE